VGFRVAGIITSWRRNKKKKKKKKKRKLYDVGGGLDSSRGLAKLTKQHYICAGLFVKYIKLVLRLWSHSFIIYHIVFEAVVTLN